MQLSRPQLAAAPKHPKQLVETDCTGYRLRRQVVVAVAMPILRLAQPAKLSAKLALLIQTDFSCSTHCRDAPKTSGADTNNANEYFIGNCGYMCEGVIQHTVTAARF